MEGNSTEGLASLTDKLHSDPENSSDRTTKLKPPKGRCEACGIRSFDHLRTIRGRAQWVCAGCGAVTEIPAEGER